MVVDVPVVRTGAANLASVVAGLRRAGAEPILTDDPAVVASATRLVLPGVGAFGAAMAQLEASGLDGALRERIAARRPTLSICLGLQLLCEASEETPGVRGLGVVPATVRRFTGAIRIPQLGWNHVRAAGGSRFIADGHAYFANSYMLPEGPPGWLASTSDHGGSFVAAMESGPVLACQFHPELSGEWGLAILRRWLAAGEC